MRPIRLYDYEKDVPSDAGKDKKMAQKIVIIGAVALGPKAACRIKRLDPQAEVTMVDQGSLISYGGCGIPYFVSGDVSDASQLQSTSFHMLRDERFFRDAKDVRVLTKTRAKSIDRERKIVNIEELSSGKTKELPYDQLVLATGSRPRRLAVPGAELKGVYTVSNLDEAVAIKAEVAAGGIGKAVIIGGGAIGLEMAEALSDLWGVETSVVEIADQILPGVTGRGIAVMAQHHLREKGLSLYLSHEVLRIDGDERVRSVVTDKNVLETDLVIMAVGVWPNSDLAKDAGLRLTDRGAISVNKRMQTSDPFIYAGGDCVEIPNLITGKPAHYPLGSMANRQGRVIGTNIAGGSAEFDGAVGSFVIKLFDISVASAGLAPEAARKEGFDAVSAFVAQFDRAHFYPEKDLLYLELTVDRKTGQVLGIQGLGEKGDSLLARVNAVAALLRHQPKISEISNLELPYSPPFSSAMDILNALGNTAENIIEGRSTVIEPETFAAWWENRGSGDVFFLDCRGWGNAEPFVKKYPDHWKSIPQDELRSRMEEVPRDRPIVLICNTGVRSYEAQVLLKQAGITHTFNLQGGMAALKKSGIPV
jgi:NADPH-dependent 2,4-dienoyl-CoA reductase/sulfur reductase-like enzyme/rhodanese-related sulfurtransferase